jgi:hypothetical protein
MVVEAVGYRYDPPVLIAFGKFDSIGRGRYGAAGKYAVAGQQQV